MSTYIERLKYIEKRIKCIILGHNIEYGYNYEKGLTIQRCSRCYKILSKGKPYLEKVKWVKYYIDAIIVKNVMIAKIKQVDAVLNFFIQ